MDLLEWNLKDALAVEREEGIEEGFEIGRKEGIEMVREEARDEIIREVLELWKQGYRAEQIEAMVSRKKSDK
ncbi:hypothetical protein AGMMS4952_16210 [Spirochaetia bacterium]|nr:hypothetical protein AGMMS4952_16210 [Spirochaetia bacterium]